MRCASCCLNSRKQLVWSIIWLQAPASAAAASAAAVISYTLENCNAQSRTDTQSVMAETAEAYGMLALQHMIHVWLESHIECGAEKNRDLIASNCPNALSEPIATNAQRQNALMLDTIDS